MTDQPGFSHTTGCYQCHVASIVESFENNSSLLLPVAKEFWAVISRNKKRIIRLRTISIIPLQIYRNANIAIKHKMINNPFKICSAHLHKLYAVLSELVNEHPIFYQYELTHTCQTICILSNNKIAFTLFPHSYMPIKCIESRREHKVHLFHLKSKGNFLQSFSIH